MLKNLEKIYNLTENIMNTEESKIALSNDNNDDLTKLEVQVYQAIRDLHMLLHDLAQCQSDD